MSALPSYVTAVFLFTIIAILKPFMSEALPLLSKSKGSLPWNLETDVFDNFDSSCTLHLVELHSIFPYSSIKRPFQMTTVNMSEACKPTSTLRVFKTRHHNCLIQLVVAPDDPPHVYGPWEPLKLYWTERSFYEWAGRYQNHALLVLILSQLLRDQDYTAATTIFQSTLKLVQLPQAHIAILAYQIDKYNSLHVEFGLYQCSYCANTNLDGWYTFQCTQGIICYEEIKAAATEASTNNKGVYWSHAWSSTSNPIQSPKSFHKITGETVGAASLSFMLESSNLSWPEQRERTKLLVVGPDRFPQILSLPKTPHFVTQKSYSYEFYPVGRSRGIRFITSDGVTEPKEAISTWSPLTPSCWLALGTCMVLSALVATFICATEVKKSHFQAFSLSLIWNFRVIVENCGGLTPLSDVRSRYVIRCCKILLAFWLLMGIVISNAYKGVVKSSFFVSPVYETHWKMLKEIQNFSLYTIITDDRLICKNEPGVWKYNLVMSNWELLWNLAESPFYSEMRVYHRGVRGANDSKSKQDSDVVDNMRMNMTLICESSLDNVLGNELSVNGTATVLLAEDLDKYYKIFLERASRNRFAHNNDGDDHFFIRPRVFAVNGGVRQHQKPVRDRIKVLLSSGIYFMWEKWERFNAHGGESKWQVSKKPRPLSMNDVNIILIFWLLLAGLLLASLRFSFEKRDKVVSNCVFFIRMAGSYLLCILNLGLGRLARLSRILKSISL